MVLTACRQRHAIDQQQNHPAQLRHVLAAFLCEFDIAPKLRTAYWIALR
jgi:hypothetical protein